jgi:hypothetical protein
MQTQTNSNDIVQLLNDGIVSFTYTTQSGETRNAKGTTNETLLPEAAKGTVFTVVGGNVTYYDLNSNGIRTFNLSNLDEGSVSAA